MIVRPQLQVSRKRPKRESKNLLVKGFAWLKPPIRSNKTTINRYNIVEETRKIMPELDAVIIDQIASRAFRGETNFADEAEPYTIDEVLRAFTNLRNRMMTLLDGLTLEQVNYNPDPLSYSLSEVVTHLSAAQGQTYNGLIDLSASKLPHVDPVPRGAGAGAEKGRTSEMLREQLQKATDSLIEIVRQTYSPSRNERID